MNRRGPIRAFALVIALVAIVSFAHAANSIAIDPGLQFLGQWSWNTPTTAIVKTRIQNLSDVTVVVTVGIKARALDGTTVGASTRIQLRRFSGIEVTQELPKPVTSLFATTVKGSKSNSDN